GQQADQKLRQELRTARESAARPARELEEIVEEADQPEADGDEEDDPNIAVAQVGPEERRQRQREQDQDAAHRRRALLGDDVRLRTVGADRLALALLLLQPADRARAQDEADDEGGHHGAATAERQVAEEVEDARFSSQGREDVEQHRRPSVP